MAESPEPAVRVRRVHHVGIAVDDLETAVALFSGAFGLHAVHRERNDEQGVDEVVLAAEGHGAGGDTEVQLLGALGPATPVGRFLERRGPGLQQLALEVDDVDAAADALRARGVRLLYETARPGTAGTRVNFVHPSHAGGVLIELVEPARKVTTRRAD